MSTRQRPGRRDEAPAVDQRRATDDVSYGIRVAALWSVCFIAVVAGIVVLAWMLSKVGLVTTTVGVSIMLCALLQPFVTYLQRVGVPRVLAAVVVFIVGIVVFGVLIWFVVSQIANAHATLTDQLTGAAKTIDQWLVSGPLHMSPRNANRYTINLEGTISENADVITNRLASTATSALGLVSGAVLCIFATLFLMLDDGRIWGWVVGLFPVHIRSHVREAGNAAWRTLTIYMRSLVLLAAVNALAMVPVMLIAGIPLVIPLAVLLFLGSLVPLIGVIVAGVIVALIALVTQGVTTAIVVTIILVVVVQLFGNLLNPVILGKFVAVHPLAILVTVTAGTLVAGAFGAFVAVPLVAVINNAIKVMRVHEPAEELVTEEAT
ncbi:AI-2E family transporter [Leekyejoonella antrihumi]|uniref:AI-2E family transporter n=1 Tax=Leekyejoonella antrihumi TaxID=1660198 RepID=A0A563DW96_9MICO|nr:AI-2E family transporter [Leekyejoonella antrihumi]TWP34213.1 AI-2E family transporter [Leekyejoonella antrihumi]